MIEIADYFIVLDEGPIKGSPTPKYDLMVGNPDEATGTFVATGRTMRELVRLVPDGCPVWRTFLQRTDGKTGKRPIAKPRK